ncbi:MAG: ABC transporter permease, partial [Burkholderiales bacterium]
MNSALHPRDPAAAPRLLLAVCIIALLWPGFSLTEFEPAALFEERSRATIVKFVGTFFPLETSPEFLGLVLKSTLETLAIATAGMAFAVLIGWPLALVVTRSLSISRIGPGPGSVPGRLVRLP